MDIFNAYHEAAHAVFNVIHHCTIVSITLSETKSCGTLSDRDMIMSLCAGLIGEEICSMNIDNDGENETTLWMQDICGKPMNDALSREYKRNQPSSDFTSWSGEYGQQLANEVRSLLKSEPYKKAVMDLATELNHKKQIEGPEAEAIIRKALNIERKK